MPQNESLETDCLLSEYPKNILEKDGLKLAKHLKNRGRPTERTWKKFKEARTTVKARGKARKMEQRYHFRHFLCQV